MKIIRRRVRLGPRDWPTIYLALCRGLECGGVEAIAFRRVLRRIGAGGMAAAARGVAPMRLRLDA